MAVDQQQGIRARAKFARSLFLEIFPEWRNRPNFSLAKNPFNQTFSLGIAIKTDKTDISVRFRFTAGVIRMFWFVFARAGHGSLKVKNGNIAFSGCGSKAGESSVW
ncbi:MAG: hypothetical protein H6R01_1089 [Burkholderiaceae bacterium]|nr:hypothetical protein [Burkholderiaceae bacterium]